MDEENTISGASARLREHSRWKLDHALGLGMHASDPPWRQRLIGSNYFAISVDEQHVYGKTHEESVNRCTGFYYEATSRFQSIASKEPLHSVEGSGRKVGPLGDDTVSGLVYHSHFLDSVAQPGTYILADAQSHRRGG